MAENNNGFGKATGKIENYASNTEHTKHSFAHLLWSAV